MDYNFVDQKFQSLEKLLEVKFQHIADSMDDLKSLKGETASQNVRIVKLEEQIAPLSKIAWAAGLSLLAGITQGLSHFFGGVPK